MYIKNLRPDICPISTCGLLMNGCTQFSPKAISMDGRAPYGVFVLQNNPNGWTGRVCFWCKN